MKGATRYKHTFLKMVESNMGEYVRDIDYDNFQYDYEHAISQRNHYRKQLDKQYAKVSEITDMLFDMVDKVIGNNDDVRQAFIKKLVDANPQCNDLTIYIETGKISTVERNAIKD